MRGGVERIFVSACAKREMTETGSAVIVWGFSRTSRLVQMGSPSDMMIVRGKEGEKKARSVDASKYWLGE